MFVLDVDEVSNGKMLSTLSNLNGSDCHQSPPSGRPPLKCQRLPIRAVEISRPLEKTMWKNTCVVYDGTIVYFLLSVKSFSKLRQEKEETDGIIPDKKITSFFFSPTNSGWEAIIMVSHSSSSPSFSFVTNLLLICIWFVLFVFCRSVPSNVLHHLTIHSFLPLSLSLCHLSVSLIVPSSHYVSLSLSAAGVWQSLCRHMAVLF